MGSDFRTLYSGLGRPSLPPERLLWAMLLQAQALCKGPGMEAKLAFLGHALIENRSGLLVDACLTKVSGHAERIAALAMIEPYADRPRPITLGAERGYDAEDFVNELRSMKVRPHVAQNLTRSRGRSAIDGRTNRLPGFAVSQRIRKRIEEGFGWMKTVAGLDRPKLRGGDRVGCVNGHRSFPGCGLPKFPTWQVLVSEISRRRDRSGSSRAGGRGVWAPAAA